MKSKSENCPNLEAPWDGPPAFTFLPVFGCLVKRLRRLCKTPSSWPV